MSKTGAMIVPVDMTGNFEAVARQAREVLLAGGVVAYPTETFYGLGVDIRNEDALKRLFEVKERPSKRPVLILVSSIEQVEAYVKSVPPSAHELIRTFWPGGLTLVFEADSKVSRRLTAGSGKIGIRLSGHPLPTALARTLGAAITGTSANMSDSPALKSGQAVREKMGNRVDLILDAGTSPAKAGSTILDVTVDPPRILRQGVIRVEDFNRHGIEVR